MSNAINKDRGITARISHKFYCSFLKDNDFDCYCNKYPHRLSLTKDELFQEMKTLFAFWLCSVEIRRGLHREEDFVLEE